jgi:hypothetical protein
LKVTAQLFHDFATWIRQNKFPIRDRTGEKTIQHQLAVFLDKQRPHNIFIELEVNCRGMVNGAETAKKEIDVFWENGGERNAIELKFCRDPRTYNLGIFYFLQDIRFGEELISSGFESFGALFLSDVKEHYTEPRSGLPRPGNALNMNLYHKFRVEKCAYGDTRLVTGTFDKTISLTGRYSLAWHEFVGDIKFTFVCLSKIVP